MAGAQIALGAVHSLHLKVVIVVADAIHQGRDPVGIEIQSRYLLPETLAALPVGPHDLGVHQLAGEQEHQLLLLAGHDVQVPVLIHSPCVHADPLRLPVPL